MKHTSPLRPHQPASWLGRLAEKFRAVLNQLVPYGYEDANGFHYGAAQTPTSHVVRFHSESPACHARHYRTRYSRSSFHSYRIVTRDFPA